MYTLEPKGKLYGSEVKVDIGNEQDCVDITNKSSYLHARFSCE